MAAYKAVGFSEEFIEKINKRKITRVAFFKKIEKIIERIFDKKSVPKKKTVKKQIEEKPESDEIEDDNVDDDNEDDDGPEEDEAIMVDDEDCEEVEEFVDDFIDDD
jgi:hypothetical protein